MTIRSHVSRAFGTSMEVWSDVWVEDQMTGGTHHVDSAIYTFVAVDNAGRPVKVPEVVPERPRRSSAATPERCAAGGNCT